ncbi:Smr/MutS family protein [Sediminicola luteus]|uniref:DNA mismatch repair protein MutS n=1 Tax=Sediminicola luteus TaxID=319238 RepID=A0A2A4GA78_9FLAO|nr:Smr/MutS family protein [Sediminicola luteus]PCE64884.1 DNA mismatch repair protein MutS [Sediminicola luteus]
MKVGDRVMVLDDTLEGVVAKIEGVKVTLEDADGFLLEYPKKGLVVVSRSEAIQVSNFEVAQIKSSKEGPKKRKPVPKMKNVPTLEVDLHIHQLTRSTRGMGNYEMLNLQLETAKRQLEFARRKHIPKVILIHGVGEGILREELHYLIGRMEHMEVFPADFQKYGWGATEVRVYQN